LKPLEGPCKNLKDIRYSLKYYFTNAHREITEKNLSMLKIISICAFTLSLSFFILGSVVNLGWMTTEQYFKILPTMLVFVLFSFFYKKREKHNYYLVQTVCVLFYFAMLYHFIDISIFAYTEMVSTFISLFFMIIPVLFIIHPAVSISLMGVSSLLYGYLIYKYKSGTGVTNDIFTIVIDFIVATIVMSIVLGLRMNDYNLCEHYIIRSRMDQLTGLLNKCSYEYSCRQALKSKPYDAPCALFIFDIDNFKSINDECGHLVGDRALEIIGEVLSETFRSCDYVGRIGGDEFSAFVLPGSDYECLSMMAQRVQEKVAVRTQTAIGINISLSVGIAVSEYGTAYYDKFFVTADGMLYSVKSGERGSINIRQF